MTWGKPVLFGLGVALVMVLGGAAVGYFLRTSSAAQWMAYVRHADSLRTVGAAEDRAHVDSAMTAFGVQLHAATRHVLIATRTDTMITSDTTAMGAYRDSLRQAQSDAERLRVFPPLVAHQDTAITDLTVSRNNWRLAFNDQAQATATTIALHASDTLFRNRLLATLDSLPKAPRTLWQWLGPKPYVRTEWGVGGLVARAGVCIGPGC